MSAPRPTGGEHVLILSAPVGAGHDVAAARLAADLTLAGRSAEVDDGLALLGRWTERFVISTYRFQLDRAVWSWRALYAITRHAWTIRMLGCLLAVLGGRRLERRVADSGATLVVSTYPLVSAALAALRRRGRLPVGCAALITDFDPHPAWIHPDLDLNLSGSVAIDGAVLVQPPVGSVARADGGSVRERLGIGARDRLALVVGGAWGVGSLEAAALALVGVSGMRVIVVCGRNEALRDRLVADVRLEPAIILGFRNDLPELLAASDVLIQHAGGLTCAEAFALGVPLVMFDPIKGHGAANTRSMVRAGVATLAPDAAALVALVRNETWWADRARETVAAGRSLFERPCAGACAVGLLAGAQPVLRPSRSPLRARVAVVAMTFAGLLSVAVAEDGLRGVALIAARVIT